MMNFRSGGTGENVMPRVMRGHVKDPAIVKLYLNILHLKSLIVLFRPSNISHVMKNLVQVRNEMTSWFITCTKINR